MKETLTWESNSREKSLLAKTFAMPELEFCLSNYVIRKGTSVTMICESEVGLSYLGLWSAFDSGIGHVIKAFHWELIRL